MKKLFLILSLSLLVSCGRNLCEGAGLTSKHGFCIFENGFNVDMNQVDQVVDTLLEVCAEKYERCTPELATTQFSDTSITFHSEEEIQELYGEWAFVDFKTGEIVNDSFSVHVIQTDCLTRSALAHEMLHVVNITVDGTPEDYGHSGGAHPAGWFVHAENGLDESVDSIENKTTFRLWQEMCN